MKDREVKTVVCDRVACERRRVTKQEGMRKDSMHIRMYVCTYVRMYVCMYVRTYVCMYVCMCVCVCVTKLCVKDGVCESDVSARQCRHIFSPALQCHLLCMRHHCGPGMG